MIITLPTLIIVGCVLAFVAVNIGDRSGKRDFSIITYVALGCFIGYVLWPIVQPVVSPFITWWIH